MSQIAYLLWYTNDPRILNTETLSIILDIIGCESVESLYVHPIQSGEDDPHEDLDIELIASNIPAEHVLRHFNPDVVLVGRDDYTSFGNSIAAAIEREIDDSIRGPFKPDRAYFSLGQEWQQDARDESTTIAMTMSIGVWCYGMPIDVTETEVKIGNVSAVREVTEKLSQYFDGIKIAILCYF